MKINIFMVIAKSREKENQFDSRKIEFKISSEIIGTLSFNLVMRSWKNLKFSL